MAPIAHRGPDDSGIWFDAASGVGFGHRRLSILDLSQRGHQPMESAGGLRIAYNGEIYNFPEIRHDLEQRGCRFQGGSDTEVLLAAVETWGLHRALARCNGMFAFALWDPAMRRVYLVRDRVGEKPLYYGWVGSAFAFASELDALRALPGFSTAIDRGSLDLLLRHGYVPGPRSIFSGISKLPPGSVLSVEVGEAVAVGEPEAYWSALGVAQRGVDDPLDLSPQEAVDELERLLSQAVRRRLIADVPLGAFLSGGVDSSTVVALMQKMGTGRARTFTIGFRDERYDEARTARRIAESLGTDHTEVYLEGEDAFGVVPELPEMFDEPFADSSQIPTHLVARLTRQHVTVALSGDGGDELFCGYPRYRLAADVWRVAGKLPVSLRRLGARSLQALPLGRWELSGGLLHRLALRYGRAGDIRHKVRRLAGILEANDSSDLYRQILTRWPLSDSLVTGLEGERPILGAEMELPALPRYQQRMMLFDLVTYLPDDILAKVDRAAMAVSLETRLPLLDPEVIELAWRMPLSFHLRDGETKWPLRQIQRRHIPRKLTEGPKMGFGVPLAGWLRGPLRSWADDLLSAESLAGQDYLRPEPIRRCWEAHLSGANDLHAALWPILVFQQWSEHHRTTDLPPAREVEVETPSDDPR